MRQTAHQHSRVANEPHVHVLTVTGSWAEHGHANLSYFWVEPACLHVPVTIFKWQTMQRIAWFNLLFFADDIIFVLFDIQMLLEVLTETIQLLLIKQQHLMIVTNNNNNTANNRFRFCSSIHSIHYLLSPFWLSVSDLQTFTQSYPIWPYCCYRPLSGDSG